MKLHHLSLSLLVLVAMSFSKANACTIFASHKGSVPFAGKIRDTMNHHRQELRVVYPEQRQGETESYFGLFAVDGAESITFSPLKMGVNQHGVFVGFATPSSVPSQIRKSLPFFKDLTHYVLTRAKTAREAYDILKNESRPLGLRILLIADASESFLMENGADANSLVQVRSEVATNHFQSRQLRHLNTNSIDDSIFRSRLAENRLPLLDFLPDEDAHQVLDALWVSPTLKKSTYTRSEFVVLYPPGKSPLVKVRLENSGEIEITDIELQSIFAANACPSQLLSAHPSMK